MSGDIFKYIGHNQWDGLNFDKFYNKAITGDYEKIILFCQNEWAWHVQGDPVLFEKLQSFCEENNKLIYIITGSAELCYPVAIKNTVISWWSTYWIGKTLGALFNINNRKILSIGSYDKVEYKYHYISMNNRPHNHRCLLIDLLAKNKLLDYGAVSLHQLPVPEMYTWRYFDAKPLLLESEFPEDKNQYRITEQYYESFAQLISESSADTIILSEKTAIPLLLGKPFLVASQMHYHKFLKSLGFELFEEIFDYSFDDEPDEEKRYEMLLENFTRLVQIPKQELYTLQLKIAHKLEFNKKHAKAIPYDMSTYPELAIETINWYRDTGNVLDHQLISDYENLEMHKGFEI
jgi:hypothetical protein